jgi:hypothetical protein
MDMQPPWVTDELPPQAADIARQIAALRERAKQYEGVAGVLWQTGPALLACVRELFTALQFETEPMNGNSNYDLRVNLDGGRRLLVEVVSANEPIDRRSTHISRVLRALQEDAGETDRVIIAANVFPSLPVPSRHADPVTTDAMRLIQGLGANFVPTSALFGLWKSSLHDFPQAKKSIFNLYSMDGGIFR